MLDVSDLSTGAAPALDYLQDGTLHHPDGSTFPVGTQYTPAQFVELADGSIVWRTVDRSAHGYVEIRDPDGNYHDPVRIDSELSVNSAHSIVGWLTPSGR